VAKLQERRNFPLRNSKALFVLAQAFAEAVHSNQPHRVSKQAIS
jgi:hypothetical protein